MILPLGDGLVAQLETECATASALTCVANFSTCAQGVLAKNVVPTESAKCLLDTLINGSPAVGALRASATVRGSGRIRRSPEIKRRTMAVFPALPIV